MLHWPNRLLAIAAWFFVGWYWWAEVPTPDIYFSRYMLLIPVALIWFSEPLGDATGFTVFRWTEVLGFWIGRRDLIDTPATSIVISLFGWAVLLSPIWLYSLTRPG